MTRTQVSACLNSDFYRGRSLFRFETQESLRSYRRSPGIRVLTTRVESWDDMSVTAPKRFADIDNIRKDVLTFLSKPAVQNPAGQDNIQSIMDNWSDYFQTIPQTLQQVAAHVVSFDLSLLATATHAEQLDAVQVRTAREVVEMEQSIDCDNIVTHTGLRASTVRTRDRVLRERVEAAAPVELQANTWAIVLRRVDAEETLVGEMTTEEEMCPIMLARVTKDVTDLRPDAPVIVEWWRQKEGNPNKTFTRAVLSGYSTKAWVQTISRSSILLANIQIRCTHKDRNKPKKLPVRAKKDLVEIGHEALQTWKYVPRIGLVW